VYMLAFSKSGGIDRMSQTVPVSYVELSPADEALVLASLDPIAAMAGTDKDKLAELLADAQINDDALRAAIADVANLPTAATSAQRDRCEACGQRIGAHVVATERG